MKRKNFIAAVLLIAASQLASAGIFGITDSIGAGQGGIIGGIIGDVGEGGAVKYISQFQAPYFLITSASIAGFQRDYKMHGGENEIIIHASDYPSGSYIVSVQENGKILGSKQVVK